jgi:peptidoglycan/LPS O-acetylase OafA/YrhL
MAAERDNNFDLIRLYAALQVLYIHATDSLGLPQAAGLRMIMAIFAGVPVFFVISGFLVTDSLLRNRDHLRRFVLSRSLRIYPALWLNLAVINLMLWADGAIGDATRFLRFSLAQMVVGSDWLAGWLTGWPDIQRHALPAYPSGVLWTLSVELGFYLLIAALLYPVLRLGRLAANSVLLVAIAASLGFAGQLDRVLTTAPESLSAGLLMNTPMCFFWIFVLGAAARLNWPSLHRMFENTFPCWLAAYLALDLACIDLGLGGQNDFEHEDVAVVLKIALMAGCVISFAYSWRGLARVLRGNDLSYGLYLFHMPVIVTMKTFGLTGHLWLWPVVLAACAAAAAASWILVEKPALALKRRGLRAQPVPAE